MLFTLLKGKPHKFLSLVRSSRLFSPMEGDSLPQICNGGSPRRYLAATFQQIVAQNDTNKCLEYDQAVRTLNSLQTLINLPRGTHRQSSDIQSLMAQWLECLGYSLEDLDRLEAVHISGTKGKGSTSALTESMLRHSGYKTGLFTSPHLRRARERIRINGSPLTPQSFASYFSSVHDRLKENSKLPLPGYFHFLTLMAFDVFLREKVDVAVIEVGIGGEFDSTNVMKRPRVCGVSALGMDHIALLGDTIGKIAWHKAGIFKAGVPAFTQPQPEEAMQVLRERAAKMDCQLTVAPAFEQYFKPGFASISLGLDGQIQRANASLALQLVNAWLSANKIEPSPIVFEPTAAMLEGLRQCRWPGRFQRLERGPFSFWIDGAHTAESIQLCAEWFHNAVSNENLSQKPTVLLFNTTGPRQADDFLKLLKQSASFSLAIFSPTVPRLPPAPDSAYNVASHNDQVERCRSMAHFWNEFGDNHRAETASTVEEALLKMEELCPDGSRVLVTGSLHLVGALLEALDEPVV